jgi:hypothetical protein
LKAQMNADEAQIAADGFMTLIRDFAGVTANHW